MDRLVNEVAKDLISQLHAFSQVCLIHSIDEYET
jgi:hypothetical protein